MRAVRLLAGDRFSSNAANKKRYINLISLWYKIVQRNLISQNPRVTLSTFDLQQKPAVMAAERWLNQELIRMNFAHTMKRIVGDGLLSMGIAKVCLATPEDAAVSGWGLQAGHPYISRVDQDDFVMDHRARESGECQFMGCRYRVPYEIVKNNSRYNKKARDRMTVSEQMQYNHHGDERIGQISRENYGYEEDLYDMVELWEFYLPLEKKIVIVTEDDMAGPTSAWEGNEPLALYEGPWLGPDEGPYPLLEYEHIPGQLFAKGPVQDVINLDEGANEGYRKLMRQAARLKTMSLCRADSPGDGKAITEAMDGQMVPVQDPNAVVEMTTGGPHPGLFQWTREVIGEFMRQGGNLLTMGGLASQAGTLGQEELLAQQSNGQIASMQDVTLAFVSKCADRMLWYYWYHPSLKMEAMELDPTLPDVQYQQEVFPHNAPAQMMNARGVVMPTLRRTGDKPQIKIDPYSMRHKTPQQRAKDLVAFLTGIYVPLAPVFQAQGIALDLNALTGMIGKYSDTPDLQSIFTIQEPPQGDVNAPAQGPGKPPKTEREYTRRSIGGESSQAQDMETDNELSSMAAMEGSESY